MRNQRRSVSQLSLDYPLLGSALAKVRDADALVGRKRLPAFYRLHLRPQRRSQDGQLGRDRLGRIHLDDPRPSHMKTDLEHRVPLSTQAKELLTPRPRTDRPQREQNFPPSTWGRVHWKRQAPSRLLRKLEIPTVPHGFRTSFRNWAVGTRRHRATRPWNRSSPITRPTLS